MKESASVVLAASRLKPLALRLFVHPSSLILHPYRAKIIDEFIKYAKGFPHVWWAQRMEIANWCLERGY